MSSSSESDTPIYQTCFQPTRSGATIGHVHTGLEPSAFRLCQFYSWIVLWSEFDCGELRLSVRRALAPVLCWRTKFYFQKGFSSADYSTSNLRAILFPFSMQIGKVSFELCFRTDEAYLNCRVSHISKRPSVCKGSLFAVLAPALSNLSSTFAPIECRRIQHFQASQGGPTRNAD